MSEISVIVPVYNSIRYLPRCLGSLLSQTFTDFELLLIDDGSTDGSGELCESYAARDSRVRTLRQSNRGQAAARNAGIDLALSGGSKYLAFVDSDDFAAAQYLEALYEAIRCGVKISSVLFAETDGRDIPAAPKKGRLAVVGAEDYYCNASLLPFVAWGKLFDRSCFESLRFPEVPKHEDTMLIYRLIFGAERIAVSASRFYFYFINRDGVSAKKRSPYALLELEAMDAQLAFFAENGYDRALRHCAAVEARMIGRDISEADGVCPEQKRLLEEKLRQHIRDYGLKS